MHKKISSCIIHAYTSKPPRALEPVKVFSVTSFSNCSLVVGSTSASNISTSARSSVYLHGRKVEIGRNELIYSYRTARTMVPSKLLMEKYNSSTFRCVKLVSRKREVVDTFCSHSFCAIQSKSQRYHNISRRSTAVTLTTKTHHSAINHESEIKILTAKQKHKAQTIETISKGSTHLNYA